MSGLNNNEWGYLIVSFLFVYYQFHVSDLAYKAYGPIKRIANANNIGVPPAKIFGVMWFITYAFITASLTLFWINTSSVGTLPTVTMSLFFVNIIINKTWSVVFFTMRKPLLAFFVSILIFATCGTIAGLIGYQAYSDGKTSLWISFAMILPYLLVSVYAMYLNLVVYPIAKDHFLKGTKKNTVKSKPYGVTK